MQIAEAVAGKDENDTVIPGELFLQIMSQPHMYELLASDIAPGPDDYLTNIIEELADYDYTSVASLRIRALLVIAMNPALELSEENTANPRHVRDVLESTRLPKAA